MKRISLSSLLGDFLFTQLQSQNTLEDVAHFLMCNATIRMDSLWTHAFASYLLITFGLP